MYNASLTLVGSGIKLFSHLTPEAKINIEQADKVLYLVNDAAIKEWIHGMNVNSVSLDHLYFQYSDRLEAYGAITDYILKQVRDNQHVCVVLYGHPSVFSKPGLDAIKIAKQEGYDARILPGISAEDCLFADLMIDPGTSGCMSFEATDLLVYRRKIDASCHLIIWQIDAVGVVDQSVDKNKKGINLLINYLCEFYLPDHEVYIYEAAQYPGFNPKIEKIKLLALNQINLSRIATLYIPPYQQYIADDEMLRKLGIR